uniref:VWFA domain-containing protein n=1 Tax=Panagrellus redivivus TaxID=6233 RepID=A0A7E4V6F1_PANRE
MTSDRDAVLDCEAHVSLFTPSGDKDVIHDAATLKDAVNALLQAGPPNTVKCVYILSSNFESCRRSVEAVQKAGYSKIQLFSSTIHDAGFGPTFIRNRINDDNPGGYAVLPYDLFVIFGGESNTISLAGYVPPFTITKEFDVGDASTVEIRAGKVDKDDKPLVKRFAFTSAAFRTVLITINVDRTHLPQVTLETIATRESESTTVPPQAGSIEVTPPKPKPDDITPSVVYTVMEEDGKYSTVAYRQKHPDSFSLHAVDFASVSDVVAEMQKGADSLKTSIFFYYTETVTTIEQQNFRDACRKAGFLNVRFIPLASVQLSLILGSLQVPINAGQMVAVLTPWFFYLITRDGKNLKIQKRGPFNEFQAETCTADSVVIADVSYHFETAVIDALEGSLRSKDVQVIRESDRTSEFLPEFLRSSVDENAVNRYTFNNFCDFDISIMGHKFIPIRFKEFPIFVTTDVDVSHLTTLQVNLVKSEADIEHLKTFPITSNTTFVRIMIFAESSCHIIMTMTVIDNADVRETAVASFNMVADEPRIEFTLSPKPPIGNATDAPSLPTSNDATDNESWLAQLDAANSFGADATLPKNQPRLKLDTTSTTIWKLAVVSPDRVKLESDDKSFFLDLPAATKAVACVGTRPQQADASSSKLPITAKAIESATTKLKRKDESCYIVSPPTKVVLPVEAKPGSEDGSCSAPTKTVPYAETKPQTTDVTSPKVPNAPKAVVATTPKPESEDAPSSKSPLPTKLTVFAETTPEATAEFCAPKPPIGTESVACPEKKAETKAQSCPPQLPVTTTTVASANTVPQPTTASPSKVATNAIVSTVSKPTSEDDCVSKIMVTTKANAGNERTEKLSKDVRVKCVAAIEALRNLLRAYPESKKKFCSSQLSFAEITSVTWPPLKDSTGKKNRSQRRRLARLYAAKNDTADEPSNPVDGLTLCDDEIDNVGSVATLPNEMSHLKLDSSPTIILAFTSDNRVLIEADESYTGDKQLLAYVRLQSGKPPIVGKDAFDALQTHPDSVFYDIIRLLAEDFDPDYPHPLWSFKTTRGADGKLLVHGGNNVVTLPIVLFGLVVNSTLLYIKEHMTIGIPFVGIRLPCGSSISDEDLKGVSEKIGTKLIIVPPTI